MSRITSTQYWRRVKGFINTQPLLPESTPNTAVSHHDAVLLHKFKVVAWPNFNKEAAKVLAGSSREKMLDESVYRRHKSNIEEWKEVSVAPMTEGELGVAFQRNVFDLVNKLKIETNLNRNEVWLQSPGSILRAGVGQNAGAPDIALLTRNEARRKALVAGEMKCSNVKLKDAFMDWLTNKLKRKDPELLLENNLRPFLQMFAYLIRCKRGRGILTNYDETRFLKLDLGRKPIYMSPMIPIDQVLSGDGDSIKPHLFQALCTWTVLEIRARRSSGKSK